MKKYLFLVLLITSILEAKNIALLISAEDGYNLYTDKDVETMKKALGSSYEYIILYKKEATSTKIREILIKLSKSLTPKDTFVFYYSGHGGRFENISSSEADKKDDFLATSDYDCINNQIDNVMMDDELNYRFAQIKAKKVVIIDACHSETMYKSFASDTSLSKLYKGCSKGDLTRAFPKNPKFENAKVSNMLFLGAAGENESSEGSDEGGVFTLALAKALKDKGNISFAELINQIKKNIKPIAKRLKDKGNNVYGAFVPSLYSDDINPSQLQTKDIFVVPNNPQKEDFEDYLDQHIADIDLSIHGDKTIFSFDERVILKAKIANQKGYIYLLDILDKNSFSILSQKNIDECITLKDRSKKQCQFTNLIASAPFGQSVIYAITTDRKLPSQKNEFRNALKKEAFKAGKVSFEVYP